REPSCVASCEPPPVFRLAVLLFVQRLNQRAGLAQRSRITGQKSVRRCAPNADGLSVEGATCPPRERIDREDQSTISRMRSRFVVTAVAGCGGGGRGAIRFEDVTAKAGLSGARSGGNSHGVGILFADLDGDGWADIYVVNGRRSDNGMALPSALYHN